MALTRANVEQVLVKRTGALLEKADLAVTFTGSNDDLNDPIGWALRQAGYTVADITAVANSDLSSVTTADTDKLLDLAELRTLETILGNIPAVDVKLGPRAESLSQLAKQVQDKISRLQKRLADDYGIGTAILEAGLLTYEFAEHTDDT